MKTLTFLALLFLSVCTFAQDDDKKKGQLGLVGGWNYSNVSASGVQTNDANGFYGGVVWEQKVVPLFRMQSGILFVQNGFKIDGIPNYDYTTLNYIQVPIVAKLKVGPIYALGGLTSAFRVGGSTYYDDGSSDKVSSDDFKGYDFGAQVGLGFQILIIGIEARYTWGLTDIAKGGVGEMNNQAFSLGAHLHLF